MIWIPYFGVTLEEVLLVWHGDILYWSIEPLALVASSFCKSAQFFSQPPKSALPILPCCTIANVMPSNKFITCFIENYVHAQALHLITFHLLSYDRGPKQKCKHHGCVLHIVFVHPWKTNPWK